MNISRDRFMCSNREHMCALDNAKQFIALGTTALDRFIGIFLICTHQSVYGMVYTTLQYEIIDKI